LAGGMTTRDLERARKLLCGLGAAIRDRVIAAREGARAKGLAKVAAVTAADTIYAIDKVSEEGILEWFSAHWPKAWPVEVVMEGLEDGEVLTFPRGTPVERTVWKCILDPIDGTRNAMYDKRSAWVLAGLAPQRGRRTHLGDIVVAAMTEIPTSKMWRSDQASAVRGRGLVATAMDVRSGGSARRLNLVPSQARDFRHGFASFVKFFPEGKAETARLEEALWREVVGVEKGSPVVFDDQYLTTGGQLYELMSGKDRMLADLRPILLPRLGHATSLVCHPYDICTGLLLTEAGGVLEHPLGGPLKAPLDTTSPVAWVGYANGHLARKIRPILRRLLG
jgi:fructose-1,6-bisphosphatase/inositol monophosphatase family enzyme